MKVLVIGGNGFIGKRFLAHLVEKGRYEITNISRKIKSDVQNVESIVINRKDSERMNRYLKAHCYDIVVDLAAFTPKDIASVCSVVNTKSYIFISSAAVYGSPSVSLITEEIEPSPIEWHSYGKNKLLAEKELLKYKHTAIVIRPVVVYGCNDSHVDRMRYFFSALQNNDKIIIYGNAGVHNNYIYVDDLIQLMEKSFSLKENIVMNASGEVFDWYMYLNILSEVMNKELPKMEEKGLSLEKFRVLACKQKLFFPHNAFSDFVLSSDLARKVVGWSANTSLKEGLTKTWEWFRKNEVSIKE